jgi:hypothetical protein
LLPIFSKSQAAVNIRGIEVRLRRQARRVKSFLPRDLRNLLFDFGIAVGVEEIEERLLELKRVETLAGPSGEVVRDELVKMLSSY